MLRGLSYGKAVWYRAEVRCFFPDHFLRGKRSSCDKIMHMGLSTLISTRALILCRWSRTPTVHGIYDGAEVEDQVSTTGVSSFRTWIGRSYMIWYCLRKRPLKYTKNLVRCLVIYTDPPKYLAVNGFGILHASIPQHFDRNLKGPSSIYQCPASLAYLVWGWRHIYRPSFQSVLIGIFARVVDWKETGVIPRARREGRREMGES